MFAASTQPVLIIDSADESVVEANPAAARLLGVERTVLVGMPFMTAFGGPSLPVLQHSLHLARTPSGVADSVRVRARRSGMPLQIKLSSFLANRRTYILAHLSSSARDADPGCGETASSEVLRAIDAAPVGFLVTDSGFFVEYANRAFGEMVGYESLAEFRGRSVIRWLKFSAADLERLREQTSQRQAATQFCVSLRPGAQPLRRVEVCAVAVPDGLDTCWGFTIRELVRVN